MPSLRARIPSPAPLPLMAAKLFWFDSGLKGAAKLTVSLVGSWTRESGEISFIAAGRGRPTSAKSLGFGRGGETFSGAGVDSLLGVVFSNDPASSFPVRWRGISGEPSFGRLRGPPGPRSGPMLLSLDLPSPSSISFIGTEIMFSSGFTDKTTKVKRYNRRRWRAAEGSKK